MKLDQARKRAAALRTANEALARKLERVAYAGFFLVGVVVLAWWGAR
jgi:hypothetical protein